jgi:multidrug efflux pump subunit AcrA (membrane-fusion protein)
VNAFILTQVVPNALAIPKAAIRRNNGAGVFVLQPDDTIKWRAITTGASEALKVEVVSGLQDVDAVAMPTEKPLRDGEKVTPEVE